MTAKQIAAQALRLPVKQRARLAKHLLDSLAEKEDGEVLDAWIEEAGRRYRNYKAGKTKAKPASEVLREARRRLR